MLGLEWESYAISKIIYLTLPRQQCEFIEHYLIDHQRKNRSEVIKEAIYLLQQENLRPLIGKRIKKSFTILKIPIWMELNPMKRGEIYFASLDPIGSETQKKRPVLIVSNNANNKIATTITIVPLTSNITKVFLFEVLLKSSDTRLSKDSKAQCHQIRTISKLRISKTVPIGIVTNEMMIKINGALKLHLDIS